MADTVAAYTTADDVCTFGQLSLVSIADAGSAIRYLSLMNFDHAR